MNERGKRHVSDEISRKFIRENQLGSLQPQKRALKLILGILHGQWSLIRVGAIIRMFVRA